MALPILDGNQTAATLSTIITGGAHIPAHTVVSLGSQAISDITNGVSGSVVSISNFPSTQTILGTVTANLANVVTLDSFWATEAIKITGGNGYGIDIAGRDFNEERAIFDEGGGIPVYPRDNAELNAPFPVAGTVTANNPSGALTTRFGSVTTANTAQITSAVTNTSRKYLLAQNISGGTVTIGIGFSPTTTQGIQLPSGGGLTFDAFCPTGAVYWLGAVTGAAFTILEG